jgi:hypothetical protein
MCLADFCKQVRPFLPDELQAKREVVDGTTVKKDAVSDKHIGRIWDEMLKHSDKPDK